MKNMFVKLSLLSLILVSLLTLGCFFVAAEETAVTTDVTEAVTSEAVTDAAETEVATDASSDKENTTEKNPSETGAWLCPECGGLNEDSFCTACGEKKPGTHEAWHCEDCDLQNSGNFCGSCGAERPSEGIQINFDASQFVKNLPAMAGGMVGIFLVIGVIILTIVVLSKLTAPKKQDDE